MGIALTTVIIAGLVERRDTTIARMGVDSFVVLLLYAGGVATLYALR